MQEQNKTFLKVSYKDVLLFLTFFLLPIVGTVSHEFGHLVMALLFHHTPTLHYASVSVENPMLDWLSDLFSKYEGDFSEIDYQWIETKLKKEDFFIRCGGLLQTLGTGLLGYCFLLLRKPLHKLQGFGFIDWVSFFMALFLARQVLLYPLWLLLGRPVSGDEVYIAAYLQISAHSLYFLNALLCSLILVHVFFYLLPKYWFKRVFLYLLIASPLGALLWFFLANTSDCFFFCPKPPL